MIGIKGKHREKGFVIVIVLFSMSVLMLLGGSLLNYTWLERNIARGQGEKMKARYASEAGIELAVAILAQEFAYRSQGTVISEDVGRGSFQVTLEGVEGNERKIVSRGEAGKAAQQYTVKAQASTQEENNGEPYQVLEKVRWVKP